MKIGIDIRNIGKKRTGDEVVFSNLVKNLATIDDRNEYALFTDITDKEKLEHVRKSLKIEGKKFEIISLPTANKFTWNLFTLPGYMRKNPVDVYLTQYITPFCMPKKVKIVTIIHDVSFKVYKKYIGKKDLFFLSFLIPLSLRIADKIIAVSQFTREEIIKHYHVKEEKVDWIHNAVATDFLSSGEITLEKINAVREKYRLPAKFILYLGTLQPRKNLPTLIEAFSLFHQNDTENIKLVIAGGKLHNYDSKIDAAVGKFNLGQHIFFPGYIDEEDKAAFLKAATVFCLPSFYEGFGIPVLEAMAVGTPVVASNIPPHQEIAGNSVLYFNVDQPQELAEKLKQMMDPEKRAYFSAEGAKQISKFSWHETAVKALSILENV
jgi:glycosyltransferase involved in cell wall biosynthesis